MSLPHSLTTHGEICDDLYELMLDENRFLKANDRARGDALLTRKRAMLASLTSSLDQMRERASHGVRTSPELRTAMEKVQQTILKALLLDRENEQLLLKSTLQPKAAVATGAPPPASQLQRIYGKFR